MNIWKTAIFERKGKCEAKYFITKKKNGRAIKSQVVDDFLDLVTSQLAIVGKTREEE